MPNIVFFRFHFVLFRFRLYFRLFRFRFRFWNLQKRLSVHRGQSCAAACCLCLDDDDFCCYLFWFALKCVSCFGQMEYCMKTSIRIGFVFCLHRSWLLFLAKPLGIYQWFLVYPYAKTVKIILNQTSPFIFRFPFQTFVSLCIYSFLCSRSFVFITFLLLAQKYLCHSFHVLFRKVICRLIAFLLWSNISRWTFFSFVVVCIITCSNRPSSLPF